MIVDLERDEWDRVLMILAEKPWSIANPLIMRIGGQLQKQTSMQVPTPKKDGAHDVPDKSARR